MHSHTVTQKTTDNFNEIEIFDSVIDSILQQMWENI